MDKKFIVKLSIAIAMILALRVFIYAKDSKVKYTDEEQKLYELGKAQSEIGFEFLENEKTIDKNAIEKKAGILSSIYNLEVDQTIKKLEENVIEEQALYLLAIDSGIVLSEDEYDSKIQEIRSGFSQEEYSMFNAYLDGYGISEDDYWNISKNVYEKEFIIDKYLNEYCIENSYDDMIEKDKCDIHLLNGEYYINVNDQQYAEKKIQMEISGIIKDAINKYEIIIK